MMIIIIAAMISANNCIKKPAIAKNTIRAMYIDGKIRQPRRRGIRILFK
jgi:hypothetical protein